MTDARRRIANRFLRGFVVVAGVSAWAQFSGNATRPVWQAMALYVVIALPVSFLIERLRPEVGAKSGARQ